MNIQTIQEAETAIGVGLETLRNLPFNDTVSDALKFLLPPPGFRLAVQLEEDGRKKRNTASVTNWNHLSGEIVIFFEQISSAVPQVPAGLSDLPHTSATANLKPAMPVLQPAPVAIVLSAGTADQDLRECCQALAEAEKMGRQFYAIKWFRDSYLPERGYDWTASVQDRQRVLNRAIQEGYIETQTIPNPKNPAFPTTTLLLNREKAKDMVGSRFRPITLRGEPLSETIIRDRGER